MTPLAKLLEAALFASARPIPADELATLDPEASPAAVAAALDELREHYDVDGHGVELAELGGGWQILTRAEYTEAIERAQLAARPQRLSAAALETLAIIAYRQPIGRGEIEEIRGVAVGGVLKSLHERGLIDVTGRAEGLGRPLLYGTTPLFLEHFALRHLEELPRADELAIALRAQPKADAPAAPAAEEAAPPARSNGGKGRGSKKEKAESQSAQASDAEQGEMAIGAGEADAAGGEGDASEAVLVDEDTARPTADEV
ncbi:MAG TPA: SMC-Scp complex subunit ScpB [Gemmatimonadaceae bacterium]|nr:SMC-Scp complex subunit ScpB [Gemmatimonadaceae bacterium]